MIHHPKPILVFLLLLTLWSCASENQEGGSTGKTGIIAHKGRNYDGVYLFNNGKDIILSWTEWHEDKADNKMKWSRFDTESLRFDSVRDIPVSKGLQMHAESMAKAGIFPDGTLIAVYRKKLPSDRSRFGGVLYYSVSRDGGTTWGDAIRLVDDTASVSQSFFDIALLPDGRMGITWLDSRSERRGKTLYFARTDENNRFSEQKPVAFSTCECCRTDLYTDSTGKIRIAYRNLIEPDEPGFDGVSHIEIRDMYYLESADGGKTFSRPVRVSRDNWHVNGCPHTGPSMAYNGQRLGMVWFTASGNEPGLFFSFKYKNRLAFEPRRKISSEGRHPQMVASGANLYVVYEEYYEEAQKGYYRIILEKITPGGMAVKREISPPFSQNDHAVITSFQNRLLIVWVNRDTRNPKIMWKVVDEEIFNL